MPAAAKPPPSYEDESFKQLFTSDGAFRKPEEKPEGLTHLPAHNFDDPHFDDSIAGEIDRMRSVLHPQGSESHVDAVARHLNQSTGISLKATASDKEPGLNFFPFIPVAPTPAVPMAMASRKPYSNINNDSVFVPQNEAWLSLIRNAKRSVFIQTPDLNAKPLLPVLIDACKRGIDVTYYVCLGYNDTGELLPGQGGTNEMAANHLYSQLSEQEKKFLKVFFYVSSDQTEPINDSFKKRSCHIKLLIVDESVAVQGSGNMDTQSVRCVLRAEMLNHLLMLSSQWFHSQEINVMIDSPTICAAWREGIERNQSTAQYGRSRDDGCFYDKDGKLAAGSYGTDAGPFGWAKGFVGILNKAQGK